MPLSTEPVELTHGSSSAPVSNKDDNIDLTSCPAYVSSTMIQGQRSEGVEEEEEEEQYEEVVIPKWH